ncbi:Protein adenylyltransferase SelO-1, mitochondrial, partial [Geodia barretti]
EKRSGDRAVWLEWLSRYSHRLHRDLDSGTDVSKVNEVRLSTMKQNNPRFILRNHILQTAIYRTCRERKFL